MTNRRIIDHPVLGRMKREKEITFTFNGKEYTGMKGETIASALLANGIQTLRTHERSGKPRGIYCNIGHCFECRVTVNNEPNVRACLTELKDHMTITSANDRVGKESNVNQRIENRDVLYDVAIVGAGPAGLSAAVTCREWGLNVLVIDEFPKLGGRLLGQLHLEPNGEWWNGIAEAEKLIEKANCLKTEMRCHTPVYHVEKSEDRFIVYTNRGVFHAKNVLLATGAIETPAPLQGWTLPGVISVGAAQVMTNVHRVKVGNKGIIIGANILSVAIARELQLAGIEIHSIVLPARNEATKNQSNPKNVMKEFMRAAHLAPAKWMRLGSKMATSKWMRDLVVNLYPKDGLKVWGIPLQIRKAVTKINGEEKVESVTICDITADGEIIKGTEKTVEVDFVCIAGGLAPLSELAAVCGCPFRYVEELGGYVPVHNERMRTPIDGLFVAGNITGIENAKVSMAQGTLAGLSIVQAVKGNEKGLEEKMNEAKINVKNVRENATIKFLPNINEGRAKMEKIFSETS